MMPPATHPETGATSKRAAEHLPATDGRANGQIGMTPHIEHPNGPVSCAGSSAGVSLLAALAVLVGAASAQAQQSLPGIVVMSPPPGMPQPGGPPPMPPPMAAPPPPAAAPAPQKPAAAVAKPKPKPKPAPAVVKDDASKGAGSGIALGSGSGIVVLVNGDPVTAYEIDQRARLLALQSDIRNRAQDNMKRLATSESTQARWKEIVEETVKANQATKSREQILAMLQEKQKVFGATLQKQAMESARASVLPSMRENAKKELIEELVKQQEAKRVGATADENHVDAIIKDIAGRNNLTPQQFALHFASQGVDISTFKARFRTQNMWVDAVRRKFGHLVNPNNRDIDKLLENTAAGEDQLELQLHRILVPVPATLDQRSLAQRMAAAEQLHREFKGCKSTNSLAAKIDGSRFEDMGARKPAGFPEPTRTLLLNAKDEEMVPPHVTNGAIELIAVCSRKVVKATEEKRREKANEIRQEEFERIARKHLRDLMSEAVIENRQ